MTCQRWFIDCDKCATLAGGGGTGGSWELSVPFDVNLKLLLQKKKRLKKKKLWSPFMVTLYTTSAQVHERGNL